MKTAIRFCLNFGEYSIAVSENAKNEDDDSYSDGYRLMNGS